MSKKKIIPFEKPGDISEDPLTELLRSGARKLITDASRNQVQLDTFATLFEKNQKPGRSVAVALSQGDINWRLSGSTACPSWK